MSNAGRTLRQTMTVARRDFVATVFTPTFLIFLLAPLIMLAFGAVGGVGAASMAESGQTKSRIVAIVSPEQGQALMRDDRHLRDMFPRGDAPPPLRIDKPSADPAAQARALFDDKASDTTAVLYGPPEAPVLLYTPSTIRHARYLTQLTETGLRGARSGAALPIAKPKFEEVRRASTSIRGKGQAAFFTVFGLFFLTLMLAGQAVGTMAEERSNKVIEVLAAAVPLESVFLGKLIGMFGVALLFIIFWGTVVTNIGSLVPADFARAFGGMAPATGAAYPFLFFAYFTMAYMLLGAVFLGVGAQAATPREIQMLSLPITIFQMGMFGFSAAAAARPESWVATAAEIFPFSSPFAMGARAANQPELWPHLLALGWQGLWVAITVTLGARWFRRGVLQSGSPKLKLKGVFAR